VIICTLLAIPENVVQHAEKANAQIGTPGRPAGGFGTCRPHKPNAKKPKEPIFLPSLGLTSKETNEKYVEK